MIYHNFASIVSGMKNDKIIHQPSRVCVCFLDLQLLNRKHLGLGNIYIYIIIYNIYIYIPVYIYIYMYMYMHVICLGVLHKMRTTMIVTATITQVVCISGARRMVNRHLRNLDQDWLKAEEV